MSPGPGGSTGLVAPAAGASERVGRPAGSADAGMGPAHEVETGATGDALRNLAAGAFVLLALALPTAIAPMGIATALCGVLTVATMARRRAAWPRTPVDASALAWFAALLLAALFAQDRAASLPRITKGCFPLLIGLAAFHARDRRSAERVLAAFFAATTVVAVYGLAVWIGQGASFTARARGLSGHYMTFAGQLLLQLPVAIAVAIKDRRPRWRAGAIVTALAALAALAVTFTRSAWIGLLVEGSVILAFAWPIGLLALAALAGGLGVFAPGAFRARILSVFDPNHPWNRQRVYMWDAGLRMFRDHPLTGVGLQDLHALYDRYRAPGSTERAGHLHNVFVQIAASMGIAGLAAFAWLYTTFFRAAARGLRRRGLGAGVRLGVTAALAGFIVAGLFEWNFGDEELLYSLYTLVGLAWATRAWGDEPADARG